jgi:DNA-binding PadR family transcriptional regulator
MESAGLASGTLYPLLARSEAAGLVGSYWEDEVIRSEPKVGRPRRKYYRITGLGARQLHNKLQQLTPKIGEKEWAIILGSSGTIY